MFTRLCLISLVILFQPEIYGKESTKLTGYWIVDDVFLAEQLKKQFASDPELAGTSDQEIAHEAQSISESMVMHYGENGSTTMHTVNGTINGFYRITNIRKNGTEMDIRINSASHGIEKGIIQFRNERMILIPVDVDDGPEKVIFKQITEKRAKELISGLKPQNPATTEE